MILMRRLISIWILVTAVAAVFPVQAFAQAHCLVVLSSKRTLALAEEDIAERWSDRDTVVYRATNGWFAITGRQLPKASAFDQMQDLIKKGDLPPDAFCSSGASLVSEVGRYAAHTGNRRDKTERPKQKVERPKQKVERPKQKAERSKEKEFGPALLAPFDPKRLTHDERRFLQLALAFEGDYTGLLDGDWGKLSQRAMTQYAWREFQSAPQHWHMAALAFRVFEMYERDSWRLHYNETLRMSYLFPFGAYKEGAPSDTFINFEHTLSSLGLSLARTNKDTAQYLHDFVEESHKGADLPYTVRKTNFAVTTSNLANGKKLYVRSHFVDGRWSTVMVSAERQDTEIFRAVTASITAGRARGLTISENGVLVNTIEAALALLDDKKGPQTARKPVTKAPKPKVAPRAARSTGTGFFVAPNGSVLTNAHVVEGCRSLSVAGRSAELVATSPTWDLALLRTTLGAASRWAVFAGRPAQLNSDVTVVGFPLSGLLSGLNVTRGAVSALRGLRGDEVTMQISAPVQPGNSGGPVLDRTGAVVGVVVSKLNASALSEKTGDIAQNVNFAIRGEIAKAFLSMQGVAFEVADGRAPMDPVDLAATASEYSVLIECN